MSETPREENLQPELAPVESPPGQAASPRDVALVEAILFMESEPMDEAGLCRASGLSPEAAREALEALALRYAAEDSGVELSRIGGGATISPKRGLWEDLKDRYGKKNDGRISRAAMETLAIIAYSQPITKAEIRSYRGVAPDNMIHLLMERGFVREKGKKDVPGKPALYATTGEFLKHFRLGSLAELPKLSESDMDRFETEGEE